MYEEQSTPTTGKIIKTILKYSVYAVILFVYTTIIARSFISCDAPLTKEILMNDKFMAAYHQDKENFRVIQYGMKDAYVQVSERRLITFDKLYFIPAAKQLQITVKYNTDISQSVGKDKIPFQFYLKDEDGNRYDIYELKHVTRFHYGYIRLCFENISLTDDNSIPDSKTAETKKYTIHINRLEKDGQFKELTTFMIYSGSKISKNIEFSVK